MSDRERNFDGRNYDRDRNSDSQDRYSERQSDRYSDRDNRYSERDDHYSDRSDRYSDREDRNDDRYSERRESDRYGSQQDRDYDRSDRYTDRRDSRRDSYRSFSSSRRDFDASNIRVNDLGLSVNTSDNNLWISNIRSGGPLARLGFRRNDYIYSVGGTRVSNQQAFIRQLFAEDTLNERVPVVVYRSGEYQTIYVEPVTIVEQVQTVSTGEVDPLQQFGIVLDDSYDDRIVVTRVLQGTPAYYAGLRPGDVITRFHGRRITAPDQFITVVQEVDPGEVNLQIMRERQTRDLSVDIPQSYTSTRVDTYRRDYDLDNNDNGRIDRRDIRMERREERRDDYDGGDANIDISTPASQNVYPPGNTGVDVNVDTNARPGGLLRSLLPRR